MWKTLKGLLKPFIALFSFVVSAGIITYFSSPGQAMEHADITAQVGGWMLLFGVLTAGLMGLAKVIVKSIEDQM